MKFQASLPPGYFVQKTYFLLYFVPFKNGFIQKLYTKDRHRMVERIETKPRQNLAFPIEKSSIQWVHYNIPNFISI